jgi:hypothetical protein
MKRIGSFLFITLGLFCLGTPADAKKQRDPCGLTRKVRFADDVGNASLNDVFAKAQSLVLEGISLNRLNDRNRLRSAIDKFRGTVDATGQMKGLDAYNAQALGILSNSGLMDALDVSKEDPRIAERYGVNDPRYQRDGAPKMIRNFLIARRLVEAGARVGRWQPQQQ